jgi:hypothetical protein
MAFAFALSVFFFLAVLLFFFFVVFGDSSTQDVGSNQPLNMTLQHLLHYKSKTVGTGPIFCGITGAFGSRPLNFRYCDKPRSRRSRTCDGRAGRLFAGAFATDLYQKDAKGAHAVSDGPQEKLDDTREYYIKPQDDSATAAVTLLN